MAEGVLLVHESPQTLDVVRRIVAETGHSAVSVADGGAALAMCQSNAFALVLVDVATQGIYAFELVQRLKNLPVEQKPYVVLLASVYDKTAYKRAPTSLYGADDYLEQHHLPDKLPLIVAKVFSSAAPNVPAEIMAEQRQALHDVSGEAPMHAGPEVRAQAEKLARRVLLDLSLYQGDVWAEGLQKGDLRERMKKALAEAKQFLSERLPEALRHEDFIEEALDVLLSEQKGER